MGNRLVAYEAIGWFRGQQTVVLSLSLVSFTSYICMYGYNTSIQKTKEKKCCAAASFGQSRLHFVRWLCVTDAQLVDQLHRKEGSFFFD